MYLFIVQSKTGVCTWHIFAIDALEFCNCLCLGVHSWHCKCSPATSQQIVWQAYHLV